MIKHNSRNNKKGSMLLLVLIIVAMALILITSALFITSSTRRRYYQYSESSQARITVTSVAESFWDALSIQNVTDDQVKNLANANAVVNLTQPGIPGMGGVAGNKTTVTFKKDTNTTISCVFSTTIDGQTENIKMILNIGSSTPTTQRFSRMLTLGGSCKLGALNIGSGNNLGLDNTIVCYGDVEPGSTGRNEIYSRVVCAGVFTGSDTTFHNDVVIWGEDAGMAVTGHGNWNINTGEGNLYFISPNSSSQSEWGHVYRNADGTVATNVPASFSFATDGVGMVNQYFNACNSVGYEAFTGGSIRTGYIYNSNVTVTYTTDEHNAASAYNTRITNTNNAITNSDAVATSIKTAADAYASDTTLEAEITAGFPTAEAAAAQLGINTDPSSATGLNLNNVPAAYMEGGYLKAGEYVIGGTFGNSYYSGVAVTRVKGDLSKGDYVFYVTSNLTIQAGCLEFVNTVGSQHFVKFVLLNNSKIVVGSTQETRNFSAAQGPVGIITTAHSTGASFSNSGGYGPATEGTIPHCYIYSAGSSEIELGPNYFLDAYIGIYGTNGKVTLASNQAYFYGRVEDATVCYGNGANPVIPFCPGPNEENSGGGNVALSTLFTMADYVYFY